MAEPRNGRAKDEKLPPLLNALSGATGGSVARVCIAPFDVLKIRFQLQGAERQYRGIWNALRTIIRDEGVLALWKGNWSAQWLYLSYSSVQFLTYYDLSQRFGDSGLGRPTGFIKGALAGVVATTVTYPFDLLRTRFAAQGRDRVYASLRSAFAEIYQREGIAAFYRGLWPSVVQIVPYMGVMFGTYEALQRRFPQNSALVNGGLAGIVSKVSTYPFDTVRRHFQVQGPARTKYVIKGIPLLSGWKIAPVILGLIREQGVKGLYKGIVPGLLKTAPASAITLWVTEATRQELLRLKTGNKVRGGS